MSDLEDVELEQSDLDDDTVLENAEDGSDKQSVSSKKASSGSSSSSSSSSSSKSSGSSGSSTSSDEDQETRDGGMEQKDLQAPQRERVVAEKEEAVLRALSQDVEHGLMFGPQTLTKITYPMLDAMKTLLQHEAFSLANFKTCVELCLVIAQDKEDRQGKKLSSEGEIEVEFSNLPHDILLRRCKEEMALWNRRADVWAYQCQLLRWKSELNDIMASAELEKVLVRRASGRLEGTELGSPEALISFALEAWRTMQPHESELTNTCLEGGLTVENMERWLAEDGLKDLAQWRSLRLTRSEQLSEDANEMVKAAEAPPKVSMKMTNPRKRKVS